MWSITLLSCLLTSTRLVSTQGAPPVGERIVGGKEVRIESYPYQASLHLNGRFICGASIIAPNKLLTAAHCTHGSNHSLLTVRVGGTNISEGTPYNLQEVVQHPRYNNLTTSHDVSVLRLRDLLEYGPRIRPIALAAKRPKVGSYQFITGYGDTSLFSGNPNRTLHGVRVPIISQTTCRKMYSTQEISNVMLCAGYFKGGKDSCQGDSGGPMVDILTKQQVGIVSWGVGCARRRKPGVYASIPDLLDFILSV